VQTLTFSMKTLPVTGILLERINTGIRWWSSVERRSLGACRTLRETTVPYFVPTLSKKPSYIAVRGDRAKNLY
jgi:hypothetical protein